MKRTKNKNKKRGISVMCRRVIRKRQKYKQYIHKTFVKHHLNNKLNPSRLTLKLLLCEVVSLVASASVPSIVAKLCGPTYVSEFPFSLAS